MIELSTPSRSRSLLLPVALTLALVACEREPATSDEASPAGGVAASPSAPAAAPDVVSCRHMSEHTCMESVVGDAEPERHAASCERAAGLFTREPCPLEGRAGACVAPGATTYFYAGHPDAADGWPASARYCTRLLKGTWRIEE